MKFKIGDKVKFKDDSDYYPIHNETYTIIGLKIVTYYDGDLNYCLLKGISSGEWWQESHFELVG